jgi:hypothetical protein
LNALYAKSFSGSNLTRASPIRLVCISDTHNCDLPLDLFPDGDLLIHAGDHTLEGISEQTAIRFGLFLSLLCRLCLFNGIGLATLYFFSFSSMLSLIFKFFS